MNPWMWLLWAAVLLVILFFASATFVAVRDSLRGTEPCPRCGYDASKEDA